MLYKGQISAVHSINLGLQLCLEIEEWMAVDLTVCQPHIVLSVLFSCVKGGNHLPILFAQVCLNPSCFRSSSSVNVDLCTLTLDPDPAHSYCITNIRHHNQASVNWDTSNLIPCYCQQRYSTSNLNSCGDIFFKDSDTATSMFFFVSFVHKYNLPQSVHIFTV